MKFELKQHFQIESARFLPFLPKDHPCARMHGHSFKITFTFVGEQHPQIGWVIDYHQIEKIVKPILSQLDHHVLNEVPGLENPTSENLCFYIHDRVKKVIPELTRTSVSETAHTECSYPAL